MSVIHNWRNIRRDAVIIDTEATGLGLDDELVEISIISGNGEVLLDTLVQPFSKPIPTAATAIHGITNDQVATAPHWDELYSTVRNLLHQRKAIFYNKMYDARIINQTCALFGLNNMYSWATDLLCAMESYADYRKVPCPKRGGYKWHKLSDAAQHEGLELPSDLHRSLADAKLTLALIDHAHAQLQKQGANA